MQEVHVFRPGHNLFCLDCGDGELTGAHGIVGIDEGRQIYDSPETAKMYAEYAPSPEDDLEDDD